MSQKEEQRVNEKGSSGYSRNEDVLMHLAVRNGPRNLICAHRLLIGTFAKSKEKANQDKWQGDEEPEGENTQDCGEGQSCRGTLCPQEDVNEETHCQNDARVEHASLRTK